MKIKITQAGFLHAPGVEAAINDSLLFGGGLSRSCFLRSTHSGVDHKEDPHDFSFVSFLADSFPTDFIYGLRC
jgi:hypothetical protein